MTDVIRVKKIPLSIENKLQTEIQNIFEGLNQHK